MMKVIHRDPQGLGRAGSFRRLAAMAGLLLVAGAGISIAIFGRRSGSSPPEPPAIDLTGADPAIVAAAESARERVRTSPRSGAAWGYLGQVLLANELYKEARICLAQAEELDPHNPRWPYLQAGMAQRISPQTIPKLQRTIELCGDQPLAPRLRLAEALLAKGRVEEAEGLFQHVLDVSPGHPWAEIGLARAAKERGHYRVALDHLERLAPPKGQAATLLPKGYHTLKAEILQRLGKREESRQEARKAEALPKDPPLPDPFGDEIAELEVGLNAGIQRVQQLVQDGKMQEAATAVERLQADYPDSDEVWVQTAMVRTLRKDLDGAEAACRRACQLAPESADAQAALGSVLLEKGDFGAATLALRRTIHLRPDFAPAYLHLSRCLQKQGDVKGAITVLRESVHRVPQYIPSYSRLAALLTEQGQAEEARAVLRNAVQVSPEDAETQALLKRLDSAASSSSEKKDLPRKKPG